MSRLRSLLLALPFALAAFGPAFAVEPDEMLADPKLEARARALSSELRCLVCQNQSIDDSQADLARDLRLLVRRRIMAGDTNEQIRKYLVARYGDFILLKPPFEPSTLLLWLTPAGVLVLGGAAVLFGARRKAAEAGRAPAPLSEEEEARLRDVLGGNAG